MYGNCNKQQKKKNRVQIEEKNLETKRAWTLTLQKQC